MPPPDLAIPTLPSRSLGGTVTFYRRLGFEGNVHPHGGYAILNRGTVELHFFEHSALIPEDSSAGCYLRVADAAGMHAGFAPNTGRSETSWQPSLHNRRGPWRASSTPQNS